MTLAAFSLPFTLNVAMSNVSLAAVSVPLHQIMRSTCPVVTAAIYWFVYKRRYSPATYISMVPLLLGVAMTTAGEYHCTILGFVLTATGVVLASIKTVATNRLVGKFSPMEILLYMSPLAATQCVIYAFATGEVYAVRKAMAENTLNVANWRFGAGLFLNACFAFALNIVSFQANKVAGALTISVCGLLKQIMTILIAVVWFSVPIGAMNGLGILVASGGAALFTRAELRYN
jgi:drug/metabolite transporter (DMT)-like permease